MATRSFIIVAIPEDTDLAQQLAGELQRGGSTESQILSDARQREAVRLVDGVTFIFVWSYRSSETNWIIEYTNWLSTVRMLYTFRFSAVIWIRTDDINRGSMIQSLPNSLRSYETFESSRFPSDSVGLRILARYLLNSSPAIHSDVNLFAEMVGLRHMAVALMQWLLAIGVAAIAVYGIMTWLNGGTSLPISGSFEARSLGPTVASIGLRLLVVALAFSLLRHTLEFAAARQVRSAVRSQNLAETPVAQTVRRD